MPTVTNSPRDGMLKPLNISAHSHSCFMAVTRTTRAYLGAMQIPKICIAVTWFVFLLKILAFILNLIIAGLLISNIRSPSATQHTSDIKLPSPLRTSPSRTRKQSRVFTTQPRTEARNGRHQRYDPFEFASFWGRRFHFLGKVSLKILSPPRQRARLARQANSKRAPKSPISSTRTDVAALRS